MFNVLFSNQYLRMLSLQINLSLAFKLVGHAPVDRNETFGNDFY